MIFAIGAKNGITSNHTKGEEARKNESSDEVLKSAALGQQGKSGKTQIRLEEDKGKEFTGVKETIII